MNSIKVLIVEDEELYADKLEMLVEKLGYEHLATVNNSRDALDCIEKEVPDFILMDVNIEGDYDGIELSEMIHQKIQTPIIFITSLQDDMTFKRIRRTQPVGYLLKPFNELQLQRSMELAVSKLSSETEESDLKQNEGTIGDQVIYVKDKSSLVKIYIPEIVYIEAEGKYCTIYLRNSRFVVRKSLTGILQKLNSEKLYQCHKSYAVNLDDISHIDNAMFLIKADKYEVPVSRRHKEKLIEKLDIL